jgi:hypothetical protein
MIGTRMPQADHVELPFEDAAARLGITTAALRKRIRRGKSLTGYQRDGRWYVLFPADASDPAAGANADTSSDAAADTASNNEDASMDTSLLREIIERQDRQIAFLQERVQRQEHIVAALLQRTPELSAGAAESPLSTTQVVPEPQNREGYVYRVPEPPRRPWWRFWQ